MDPIGASSLNFNFQENEEAILEEQKRDEQFQQIIASSRSLSYYDGKTFKTYLPQVIAAFTASLYHIAAGISMGYSGILVPALERNVTNDTFDNDLTATKSECSMIASLATLIVPVGAITGGFLMDSIGRLNTIKLAVIPTVIGWWLITGATNVTMIVAGRLLCGFGSAWGTVPATVYISEISRADLRGALVSFTPSLTSLGMLICFVKGWFFHWRTVAWMASVYSVAPVALIFLIPESPVWLVSKGRSKEAAAALRWIHKYQPQPQNRNESMAELQLDYMQKEHRTKQVQQAKKGKFGWKAKVIFFFKPIVIKPFLILSGLFFFQQFSGIYSSLAYSVSFFQEVGTTINPYFASVCLASVRMLGSCANTYMAKRFYRRPLVITSGIGMAITMGASGLFTYWIKAGTSDKTWVPVALLVLYVVTCMIGLLPLPWMMTAEVFPIEIRGVANSITLSVANLLMFSAIQTFWTMENAFGGMAGLQWFYAVISILGSVYAFIFLPETHRKKLSEISEYFIDNTIYLGSSKSGKKTVRFNKEHSVESNTGLSENLMENGRD